MVELYSISMDCFTRDFPRALGHLNLWVLALPLGGMTLGNLLGLFPPYFLLSNIESSNIAHIIVTADQMT